jgi:hypothetical protein
MYLKNGKQLYLVTLNLGNYYKVYNKIVRFIQVTRFGYNFLDESISVCILRNGHLYEPRSCRSSNNVKKFWITSNLFNNLYECNINPINDVCNDCVDVYRFGEEICDDCKK